MDHLWQFVHFPSESPKLQTGCIQKQKNKNPVWDKYLEYQASTGNTHSFQVGKNILSHMV